jgi:hypothetical protein
LGFECDGITEIFIQINLVADTLLIGWLNRLGDRTAFSVTDQIATALNAPKKYKIRFRFKLTDKDRQYIRSKGIDTIRSHTVDFIKTRLAQTFPKTVGNSLR